MPTLMLRSRGNARAAIAAVAALFFAPDFASAQPATASSSTGTPRIHLRGTARIDASAARAAGKLVLRGTLVDDAAHPLPSERLVVSVATKADPNAMLALSNAAPSACESSAPASAAPTLERADSLSIKTDDGGRFCVRLSLAMARYIAHVSFTGAATSNIDPARVDVAVDLGVQSLTLRFDPEPRVLSLDDPNVSLQAVATIEDESATTPGVNLPITLTNELGALMASGSTNASGRTTFTILSPQLGPPGRGELRLAFAGSSDVGSSVHVSAIERHTRIELTVSEAAASARLPPGAPEDGVAMTVVASTRSPAGAAGSARIVLGGSVEARIGDVIVGAAPLENGRARLVVTFAPSSGADVPLHLRYDSDSPWLEPDNELTVTLPVRGASWLRRVPLILAGAAVIAWLALGRTSRARASREKTKPPRRAPAFGEAKIDLVRAGAARSGWSGAVFDAHEGFAIAGATMRIERAGFRGVEVMAQAMTDREGAFQLPPIDAQEGDRLSAEGPLHASLTQGMPPRGELAIALVLRKRALLDRLVGWAKRRGKPFDVPDPTPGHVRRTAGADFGVARWADAVERAAYGGGVIDEHAEADVERLAPGEPRGGVPAPRAVAPAPAEGPPDGAKQDGERG